MKRFIPITVPLIILFFFVGCSNSHENISKVKSKDGVEISIVQSGAGDVALVFVHGWSCDKSYWENQLKTFSPKYKVVTVDLAGHGGSGLERSDYTVQMFGSDVAFVVNELELKRVVLIGHSMGGSVILEAAAQLKEKVIGLIGVDTYQSFTEDWPAEQKEQFLKSFHDDFKNTTQNFVKDMFPKEADTTVVKKVADDMSSAPPKVAISAMRNLFYYNPLPTLAKLHLPIVSINCDMYPLDEEGNKKLAKSFSFKMMKGVGHFLMLERPDEFNKLLENIIVDIKDNK